MKIEKGNVYEITGYLTLGDMTEIEQPLKDSAFNHKSASSFDSKLLVYLKSVPYSGDTAHIFYHAEMGRCWLYHWEMSKLTLVVESCAQPQAS